MLNPAPRAWCRWVAAAVTALSLWSGVPARGQAFAPADPQDYRAKAVRIGNLARFVEWPRRLAEADAPLVIGVVGTDAVFAQLRSVLQAQSLKGHPVAVRHLSAKDDLAACQILFVGRTEKDHLEPILHAVRRQGVLTVGESENFLGHGGVMSLLVVEGSLRLQVSAEAAKREKLVVSSKLLQLALRPEIEVGGGMEPER